ncbi:hypothetical protein [uncultured Nevskia sp.]|uniref:hypothetical protein n=1 Tax=uncultured Nevskia sp. TaxID=228950 RepID=UPI0025D8E1AC|nr:hypothetical protein [uncultured Nevskia sp.]
MTAASLFVELKRRNVHRAAMFYAAAAWLLVQIATQVFPFFDIPNSTVRIVVIAVVIGFPFAMLFSWFYEWTAKGIQLESEIDRSESVTRETGKALDRWIIAVLGLAVVVLLANTLFGHNIAPVELDRSIAVLPLINESGNPEDEYFSDGLSEELIAALLQIGDLKVIGRSSSFRFKGGNEDSKTIGEKLGVSTLLEGTVRRQGDRVRIVAQLVNARDGRGLWAQTYDRELKDIFAVQAEIAQAVAASLKLSLLGDAAKARQDAAPLNAEAHSAYLQGHFYYERTNVADFRKAVDYFDQAIRLDPEYALAYAERSEAWSWIADQDVEPHPDAFAAARRDAEKAVALDPNLAEARTTLGWLRFFVDWKIDEAVIELRKAKQLSPFNVRANYTLARVLGYTGQFEEAEALARLSVELDPLSANARRDLARVLYVAGKNDEAITQGQKMAELQPTAGSSRRWQVLAALVKGDSETALREALLEPSPSYRRFELALAYYARGDKATADASLAALIEKDSLIGAYQIAQVYAWRGEADQSFAWLLRAYDQHDTGTLNLYADPLMRGLRSDPRYAAMLVKMAWPDAVPK